MSHNQKIRQRYRVVAGFAEGSSIGIITTLPRTILPQALSTPDGQSVAVPKLSSLAMTLKGHHRLCGGQINTIRAISVRQMVPADRRGTESARATPSES